MIEQLEQGLYYVDDQSNMMPITLREVIDNYTPQKIETLFMKSELLDIYLDLPLPEEWDIISDKDRYDFIQDAIFSNNKPLQGYLRTRVTAKEVMIELFGYPPDKVSQDFQTRLQLINTWVLNRSGYENNSERTTVILRGASKERVLRNGRKTDNTRHT